MITVTTVKKICFFFSLDKVKFSDHSDLLNILQNLIQEAHHGMKFWKGKHKVVVIPVQMYVHQQ